MNDIYSDGYKAITNVITVVGVLSWIAIIVGVAFLIGMFAGAPAIGAIAGIGLGVSGLIAKAILKSFSTIILACELYLQKNRPQKDQQ